MPRTQHWTTSGNPPLTSCYLIILLHLINIHRLDALEPLVINSPTALWIGMVCTHDCFGLVLRSSLNMCSRTFAALPQEAVPWCSLWHVIDSIPRCFCWRRSSPRQETAPMHSSLWRSAEKKTAILIHLLRERPEEEKSRDALTPTTLFMASSLSESLLLSNISLRSSFLWSDNTVRDAWRGQWEQPSRGGFNTLLLFKQDDCERAVCAASVSLSQITKTSQGHTWA